MVFVAAAGLALTAVASTRESVAWTEVRNAITEPICVLSYSLPDGSEGYNAVAGLREPCKAPAANSRLQRAVDKAYTRAQPLTASMHMEGLEAVYEKGLSEDERNRRARALYLSSEDFLRAVLPRLRELMSGEGIECVGCPSFEPRKVRKATWTEFAPYLAAYAWPDPVATPKDATGRSSGAPRYSFHVCGGLNGIGELKDPDPLLVRAGFVAAYQNAEFLQSVGTQFGEALSAPEFLKLEDDDARTRYLRSHVPSETVRDPAARAAACRTISAFRADLGVEISDCSGVEGTAAAHAEAH